MKTINSIKISINGQAYTLNKQVKLDQLIKYFSYKIPLFILEHNDLIYSQTSWNKIVLRNYDKIEIVTIVGGG